MIPSFDEALTALYSDTFSEVADHVEVRSGVQIWKVGRFFITRRSVAIDPLLFRTALQLVDIDRTRL